MQQQERFTGSVDFEIELHAIERFDASGRLSRRHFLASLGLFVMQKRKPPVLSHERLNSSLV